MDSIWDPRIPYSDRWKGRADTGMKVEDIRAYALRYPEANDFGALRYTTVVRVETRDGTVGWGEGIAMWPEAALAVKVLIEDGLRELVVGEDPRETDLIWERLVDHTWWYGDGGIGSMAISAIDMALWDIRAKSAGRPLYELLGGLRHERLPACASTHPSLPTIEENVAQLASYSDRGYRFIKTGFGKKGDAQLGRFPLRDIEFVRELRSAVGDDIGLIVDFGKGVRYDFPTVARFVRECEEVGLRWIEEPFDPKCLEAHRRLRAATSTPIGGGERESTVEGFQRLIETGLFDVIGVDPAKALGITGFRKVATLVEQRGLALNTHAWSTAITTAASVHLSLTAPTCHLMEFKPEWNVMQHELVDEPPGPVGGWAYPLKEPGLGVEVKLKTIERYSFG